MAQTPTQLFAGAVASTTPTTVYTVPAGKTLILKHIAIGNYGASAQLVNVTVASSVNLLPSVSVASGGSVMVDCSIVLTAGQTITMNGPASSTMQAILSGVVSP